MEYFIIHIAVKFTIDWYETLLSVMVYCQNFTINVHGTNEIKRFSSVIASILHGQ